MGMQAIADPAFELGGVVASEDVARAWRYEGAALQHIAAKIWQWTAERLRKTIIQPWVGPG